MELVGQVLGHEGHRPHVGDRGLELDLDGEVRRRAAGGRRPLVAPRGQPVGEAPERGRSGRPRRRAGRAASAPRVRRPRRPSRSQKPGSGSSRTRPAPRVTTGKGRGTPRSPLGAPRCGAALDGGAPGRHLGGEAAVGHPHPGGAGHRHLGRPERLGHHRRPPWRPAPRRHRGSATGRGWRTRRPPGG